MENVLALQLFQCDSEEPCKDSLISCDSAPSVATYDTNFDTILQAP